MPQMVEQRIALATLAEENNSKTTKKNFDSGYHEMTEDEMDVDRVSEPIEIMQEHPQQSQPMILDAPNLQRREQSEERRTTEGSFHSAREDTALKDATTHSAAEALETQSAIQRQPNSPSVPATINAPVTDDIDMLDVQTNAVLPASSSHDSGNDDKESLLDEGNDLATSHTPSDASSPVKPLIRKSSLTFASLPAREPLNTKKSIGARNSRTSQLDQSKPAAIGQGSYLGRYTGGKSLGGFRQPDHINPTEQGNAMEMNEREGPSLARQESDGDRKIAKLHNKASTQRLHDRINMLGQIQPPRPSKSIPAIVPNGQPPNYPTLPKASTEETRIVERGIELISSKAVAQMSDDDDDDWIKPPAKQEDGISRPQLIKSRSVDVMEQIEGKDSIGGKEFGLGPLERESIRQGSPLRTCNNIQNPEVINHHRKSASISTPTTPHRQLTSKENPQKHAVSKFNPDLPHIPSTTPAGTPHFKIHHDGPLSASKCKLQSIMKSARGLFTSSAGVSAQAKMETLSPSSMKTRSKAKAHDVSSNLNHTLYPEIPKESQNATSKDQVVNEGRKTRSSTEKEGKSKEKEAKEKQRLEQELEFVQHQEQKQKVLLPETQKVNVADEKGTSNDDTEAPLVPPKPTRQSPRRLQKQHEVETSTEIIGPVLVNSSVNEATETSAPITRSQNHTSQLQKPKDVKRPVKPSKEMVPKPKPQPVSIRVGTLSQRIPLTNATLASSLQDSLPPPPQSKPTTLVKKPSNASLHTSSSNTSFKSSVAAKPKALIAAERKKEQVCSSDFIIKDFTNGL